MTIDNIDKSINTIALWLSHFAALNFKRTGFNKLSSIRLSPGYPGLSRIEWPSLAKGGLNFVD